MKSNCPYCNTENEALYGDDFICSKCNKWYSPSNKKEKPKQSLLNENNFLDEEEEGRFIL